MADAVTSQVIGVNGEGVLTTLNEVKLFNRWTFEDFRVSSRRSRRWLTDRFLLELLPRLDTDDAKKKIREKNDEHHDFDVPYLAYHSSKGRIRGARKAESRLEFQVSYEEAEEHGNGTVVFAIEVDSARVVAGQDVAKELRAPSDSLLWKFVVVQKF